MPVTEPRNPFYIMLLITGLIFISTVLAYAVVPFIEQKARDLGEAVPPREESWFRHTIHHHGGKLVLAEVAVLIVLGFLSMGLDRYRRWKVESDTLSAKIDATEMETPPPG